jgi:hypothetical protein
MTWLRALTERYREAADPLRLERRFELVLLLLALLLILQLLYGFIRLALMATPAALDPAADSMEVFAPLGSATVTAAQSNEIRNRPLLWPGRRPIEAVVEVAAAKSEKQQKFTGIKLVGVFGAGDSAGIIAQVKKKTRRIRLGEELAGWTLQSVGENEAVFTAGSRQEKIILLPESINSAGKVNKRSEFRR